MLDPWIIEEIRRREEEERRQREQRPVVELPLYPDTPSSRPEPQEQGEERGVVIVDFCV